LDVNPDPRKVITERRGLSAAQKAKEPPFSEKKKETFIDILTLVLVKEGIRM
jgi:hypothetical protein